MLVQDHADSYWDSFASDVPAIVDAVRETLDGRTRMD